MYCPQCGEKQNHINTKFCSRCGFLMLGLSEVVKAGGLPKAMTEIRDPNAISPRRRGLKQGGFMFLSGIVLVPMLALITETFGIGEFFVAAAAMLTFLAGFVRMIYAIVFQSGIPTLESESFIETVQKDLLGRNPNRKELPDRVVADDSFEFQNPAGNWRITDDLRYAETKSSNPQRL